MTFSIDDWFYWGKHYCDANTTPHYIDKSYDLTNIPVLQRRRLPEVSKRIFNFTQNLSQQKQPIIYASHNGELSQTLSIIRSLPNEVSPTKFSLSVHNAIAGLLSIIHSNKQSYQAIDSLSGLAETSIVEALGLLSLHDKIGIVYYDESLPREFLSTSDNNQVPHLRVFCMIISQGRDYALHKKTSKANYQIDDIRAEMRQIHNIVKFLSSSEKSITTHYSSSAWKWEKCLAK